MAGNFAYLNTRDLEFIIQEWLPTEKVFNYDRYKEYYSKDDVKTFLAPVLKMAKEVIEPTNDDGDKIRQGWWTEKQSCPRALVLYTK